MRELTNYAINQKYRRNVSAFKKYLNGTQGVAFSIPASGRFAVRNESALLDTTVALAINGESLSVPASPSGGLYIYDWLQKDSVVQSAPGFTLLLDTGLGKFVPVGGI